MLGQKEKRNTSNKTKIPAQEINQNILTKEGRLSRLDQTIQKKQDILTQRKKILPARRGRMS